MNKARRVLEVGMFTGTSTLAKAEIIPEGGKIVCLELEGYLKEWATPFFQKAGVEDKVDVMVGPAGDSIDTLAKQQCEKFDLIFIDADKTGNLGYYNKIMEYDLLSSTGFIIIDNALMKGRVYTNELEGTSSSIWCTMATDSIHEC